MTPRVLMAALVLGVLGGFPAGGQPAPGPSTGVRLELLTPPQLAALARSGGNDDQPRIDACMKLLGGGDAASREHVTGLLSESGAGRTAMLRAIARTAWAPSWVEEALVKLAGTAAAEELPAVVSALGSVRTRESLTVVARFSGDEHPRAVRSAALAAGARLLGRPELAEDEASLRRVAEMARGLSELQWRQILSEGLARRADREAARAELATRSLVESLRKLHVATPIEKRSALLASLMLDPLDEVRRVGFDLVMRELSDHGRIGAEVESATEQLLASADPSIRRAAAELVEQLGSDRLAGSAVAALRQETDPEAASSLLRAASRRPVQDLIDPAMRWMSTPTGVRTAAVEALYALLKAGLLDRAERDLALEGARSMPKDMLTPAACQLMAAAGLERDRRLVADLLTDRAPELRLAAAEALSMDAEYREQVLAAASTDPRLMPLAARSVMVSSPDAAGFVLVAKLPTESTETRRSVLARLAATMPSTEVVEAESRLADDPAARDSLLGALVNENRVLSERHDLQQLTALCRGLVRLAELRLAAADADGALAALSVVPEIDAGAPADRLAAVRVRSLVRLNRLDVAEQASAPTSVWLDALEDVVAQAHASAVADLIARRHAGALSPAESARLEALRARIEPQQTRSPENPG